MPRQVFISYSTEDSATATAARDYLEVEGIACWMAPRDIAPGLEYGEQIIDAIEACTVFVLLLSESSNRSRFVLKEVERAVSKGKVIIPLRIEPVQPSRSLEYFISNAQWIDGREGAASQQWDALVEAIQNHVQSRSSPHLVEVPLPATTPTVATSSLATNLPHQLTPFVGRERELAALDELIAQADVRLSLTSAERHMTDRRFADGVYFVGLVPRPLPVVVAELLRN